MIYVTLAPNSAQPYFYTAVSMQKGSVFKAIAFSKNESDQYYRRLVDLYSKAINIDNKIAEAFAQRVEAYLELRDYQDAIPDYDQAIRLNPGNAGLWNDRGRAKQETYDKNGAIDDFTHAISIKTGREDTNTLATTLENRADLYVRLGDLKQSLADYTQEIGYKLGNAILFMNLDTFRSLYPEYAKADDAQLIDKLHRMYYPNFTYDDFKKSMEKPEGRSSLNAQLPDIYLKRADVLVALKEYQAVRADYGRAQNLDTDTLKDYQRWRTPPGLKGIAIDLQSLQATEPQNISVWVRNIADDGSWDGQDPVEYLLDCHTLKVRASNVPTRSRDWQDPIPGSQPETIRDFFCQAVH